MNLFVSYSRLDDAFVGRLATDLRTREGFDVWMDQLEINPGDKVVERIEEGLSRSEVFLLVLSPASVKSQWVEYERQAWLTMQIEEERRANVDARPSTRRLMPILYKECERPAFLQPIQYVRITDRYYESGFGKLVAAIRQIPERARLRTAETRADELIGVPLRKYVLNLLKSLLETQFDELVFVYGMPRSHLPSPLAQVQKAIILIEYAEQREGQRIPSLLNEIYKVAPGLKRVPGSS
jgi:hypothetical protein